MCNRDQRSDFDCIPFWLLIVACSLLFPNRDASAAEESQPANRQFAPANAAPQGLPNRITTLDGKTYEQVVLEKVDPDGLFVLFTPAGGGSGAAKLKFRNLPPELRELYGYDPDRASDFEAAQARGAAVWLAENALWAEQRRAAQAEQAAWERQMIAEAESRRAAEEELARAAALGNAQQEPAYYYPVWWGSDHDKSFPRHPRARHHVSRRTPNVGIKSSPISPTIGPMRPLGR